MTRRRSIFLIVSVLVITAIGWMLHLRAVQMLPIDYDEDDYLAAAQRYAVAMKAGDIQAIIDYDFTFEHPPLMKILFGAAIRNLNNTYLIPERPPTDPPVSVLPNPQFRYARTVSAVLGTLEVFALALLNPLAGLLLAIDTWQIKYSSQIMLEALPAMTSLLAVLFYSKSRKNGLLQTEDDSEEKASSRRRAYIWLALSAVALGITAASKYLYAVAGIGIIADWFLYVYQTRKDSPQLFSNRNWGRFVLTVIAWGVFAVLIFWAFNPYLWNDPIGRMSQSLFYHQGYAQSEQVADSGFPAWEQLVWLAQSVPWHPGVFVVSLDLYILAFAIVGLPRLWRRYRVFALWLIIDFVFLLFWPTKWPQYLLTLLAPLTLSSSEGVRILIWEPLVSWWKTWRQQRMTREETKKQVRRSRKESWREMRKAWLWLLPGAVTLALIAFYPMIYQGAMSVTDFSTISMRDGIQGGIWREAWQGLTGQVEPAEVDPFGSEKSTQVSYVGDSFLKVLFSGGVPELLVFNVLWTVLSIALQVALGVSVAMMLNRRGVFGRGFWRTIFILPWAIPEFIGALIWLRLLDPQRGWLAVAGTTPTSAVVSGFLDDPNKTMLLLLIAATWYGFPFIMLAATAGLKMIPGDVYEAAGLDGAGRWAQFRYITWPMLFPLVMPAILIRSIFAFNQFYLFYAMQVDYPTMTFATLSYIFFSPGYFGGRFAFSAAINVFTVVVLVVLILWFNRQSRAVEGVTYA